VSGWKFVFLANASHVFPLMFFREGFGLPLKVLGISHVNMWIKFQFVLLFRHLLLIIGFYFFYCFNSSIFLTSLTLAFHNAVCFWKRPKCGWHTVEFNFCYTKKWCQWNQQRAMCSSLIFLYNSSLLGAIYLIAALGVSLSVNWHAYFTKIYRGLMYSHM